MPLIEDMRTYGREWLGRACGDERLGVDADDDAVTADDAGAADDGLHVVVAA